MSNYNTTNQGQCAHLNGFGVNHIEAMGCESWYYECEDCGLLTTQVVEYPEAYNNVLHRVSGPAVDWYRVGRIYRQLV